MHSNSQVLFYFLILNFNTLQVFQNGLVSAGSISPFNAGENIINDVFGWLKKPSDDYLDFAKSIADESSRIKSSTPAYPSSWLTKSLRTAITVTTEFSTVPIPLTFFTAMDETCLVNLTDTSLQVTLLNSVTVSTVTGGVLGHDLYQCYSYSFAWNIHACNSSFIFEAHILYKNTKYATIKEALQKQDGVLVTVIPIETAGDLSNPGFDQYDTFLKTKMVKPGQWATIPSEPTYMWFANLPFNGVYTTFKTKYTDQISGLSGLVNALIMPYNPQMNFISKFQFYSVFVKIWEQSGQMSQDFEKLSPEERKKGIFVFNLPA